MKRIGQINGVPLYDIICSRENVEQAFKSACKDHAKDRAVQTMKANPEPYITGVMKILEEESFTYSSFKTKQIWERGKVRDLEFTRTYPDRIVQHAVFNVVAPILHGTVIKDSYAAVKGRGTHACSMAVRTALFEDPYGTSYCLKMDVHHYFKNIKWDKLFSLIKKKIKCRRTLNILHEIIYGVPMGETGEKVRLPIGLFSSQILSVFYLAYFDHYCKETLGIRYYFRYMDDIVILASNKILLHNYLRYIIKYLATLGLKLKKNYAIFPVDKRRIDFAGYVHDHKQVMLRKKNKISYIRVCNNCIRLLKNDIPLTEHILMSKNAYEGMIGWCTDDRLLKKYSNTVELVQVFGYDVICES